MKIECLYCHKNYEQDEIDMEWSKLGKLTTCPHCKKSTTIIRTPRNLKRTAKGQYVKKFPGAKK